MDDIKLNGFFQAGSDSAREKTTEINLANVVKTLSVHFNVKVPHSLSATEIEQAQILPLGLTALMQHCRVLMANYKKARHVEVLIGEAKVIEFKPDAIVVDSKEHKAVFGMYEERKNLLAHVLTGAVLTTTSPIVTESGQTMCVARSVELYTKEPLITSQMATFLGEYIKVMRKGDMLSTRYAMVAKGEELFKENLIVPLVLYNGFKPATTYMSKCVQSMRQEYLDIIRKYTTCTYSKTFNIPPPPELKAIQHVEQIYSYLTQVNQVCGLNSSKIVALCYPMYMGELPGIYQVPVTEATAILSVAKTLTTQSKNVVHELIGYNEQVKTMVSLNALVFSELADEADRSFGLTSHKANITFIRMKELIHVPMQRGGIYDKEPILKLLNIVATVCEKKKKRYAIEVIIMPELFTYYNVMVHPIAHSGVVFVVGRKKQQVEKQEREKGRVKVGAGDPVNAAMVHVATALMWYVYYPFHRKNFWVVHSTVSMVPILVHTKRYLTVNKYKLEDAMREDLLKVDDNEIDQSMDAYRQGIEAREAKRRDLETGVINVVEDNEVQDLFAACADETPGGDDEAQSLRGDGLGGDILSALEQMGVGGLGANGEGKGAIDWN